MAELPMEETHSMNEEMKVSVLNKAGDDEGDTITDQEKLVILRDISTWTNEEDEIIKEKMKEWKEIQGESEDKRNEEKDNNLKHFTELLMKLPNKRFQDVKLRKNFIELNEENKRNSKEEVSWEDYYVQKYIEISKDQIIKNRNLNIQQSTRSKSRSNSRAAKPNSSHSSQKAKNRKFRNSCHIVLGQEDVVGTVPLPTNAKKINQKLRKHLSVPIGDIMSESGVDFSASGDYVCNHATTQNVIFMNGTTQSQSVHSDPQVNTILPPLQIQINQAQVIPSDLIIQNASGLINDNNKILEYINTINNCGGCIDQQYLSLFCNNIQELVQLSEELAKPSALPPFVLNMNVAPAASQAMQMYNPMSQNSDQMNLTTGVTVVNQGY